MCLMCHASVLVKTKIIATVFFQFNLQLCADGYDVTNLVSAEPAVRRRGFKLEYFLRPPVQVGLLI